MAKLYRNRRTDEIVSVVMYAGDDESAKEIAELTGSGYTVEESLNRKVLKLATGHTVFEGYAVIQSKDGEDRRVLDWDAFSRYYEAFNGPTLAAPEPEKLDLTAKGEFQYYEPVAGDKECEIAGPGSVLLSLDLDDVGWDAKIALPFIVAILNKGWTPAVQAEVDALVKAKDKEDANYDPRV